jgi:hypothetical protein
MITAGYGTTATDAGHTGHRSRGALWSLPGAVGLLAAGLALAACSSSSTSAPPSTTASAGGASATTTTAAAAGGLGGLSTVVNRISDSSKKAYSATYQLVEGSQTQSITFAQDPPKTAVITPSGSFFVNGTSIIQCEGSGSSATCTSLPSSLTSELSGITDLFSPSTLTGSLKGLEAEAQAKADGVTVTTSSANHGGLDSTCFTIAKASLGSKDTYCASNSNSVLTYVSTSTATITLTAFTPNPPASTFAPPAGATVNTIPSGG